MAPAGGTHDNPLRRVLTTRSTPRSPEALGVNPNADSDSAMLVAQALEKKADGMFFLLRRWQGRARVGDGRHMAPVKAALDDVPLVD